jgi:hypothetical protein
MELLKRQFWGQLVFFEFFDDGSNFGERWNYGIMELWNYGVIVLWRYGIMALSKVAACN